MLVPALSAGALENTDASDFVQPEATPPLGHEPPLPIPELFPEGVCVPDQGCLDVPLLVDEHGDTMTGPLRLMAGLTIESGGFVCGGCVDTGDIALSAVTTSRLADAAATTEKIADGAIVTGKIADGAVIPSKLAEAYYNQAASDARFLGISAKAVDADSVDGIDSSQLLRSDESGTLAGTLTATGDLHSQGLVRADMGACIASDCRDHWPSGPLDRMRQTNGKSIEWAYCCVEGGTMRLGGAPGGYGVFNVGSTPAIRLGRENDDAGFIPRNTVVTVGVAYGLGSDGSSGVGLVLVDGPVNLVKYGLGDASQPGQIRAKYTNDTTGSLLETDWTTYVNGETAYFEIQALVRGNSPVVGSRIVDVTLLKNGAEVTSIQGVRVSAANSLMASFFDSGGSTTHPNTFWLLGAAGSITYP